MGLEHDHRLIKSSSYLSVSVALVLVLAKIYGYWKTDSQAMLASLIDSLLDISYSAINVALIYFALRPPDYKYRFGHEKFQDIAIFSQAVFFIGSGVLVIYSSIRSLFFKVHVEGGHIANPEIGLYVMYLCVFLTFFLIAYQSYVIGKTRSGIIAADKLHYLSDFLTNLAVIVSIKIGSKIWWFDPATGICIGIYISITAFKLLLRALKNLADEEFSERDKDKIKAIIGKYKEVQGLHELKTRYAANKPFIQFHIEMDGKMSLEEAHEISENIELDILKEFVGGEVIVHQDPIGVKEPVKYREKIHL